MWSYPLFYCFGTSANEAVIVYTLNMQGNDLYKESLIQTSYMYSMSVPSFQRGCVESISEPMKACLSRFVLTVSIIATLPEIVNNNLVKHFLSTFQISDDCETTREFLIYLYSPKQTHSVFRITKETDKLRYLCDLTSKIELLSLVMFS